MRTRHVFLAAAATLLATSVALAGPWGPGRDKGPGMGKMGMGPRAAEALGITEEQKLQLRTLNEAHRNETAPLRNEMLAKREEMRRLWADPSADADELRARQGEIRALRAQMADAGMEHQLARRALLTPEQMEKLADLDTGRGKRHGRGQGGRCW